METPEKFLKFLKIVHDNLYYSEDDIAVIEEADLGLPQNKLSQDDVDRAILKLKNLQIIEKHNIYYAFRFSPVAEKYKAKVYMLNHQGVASAFPHFCCKIRHVIKFHSQAQFFEFYNQINPNNSQKDELTKEKLPSFDKDKSILYINGEKVKIAKKNDKSNAHLVLEYIFDNEEGLSAQNFYSEIADKIFRETTSGNKWMKYYRACNDIQDKIAKHTTEKIDNFLIIKTGETGYVRINPDYLPK